MAKILNFMLHEFYHNKKNYRTKPTFSSIQLKKKSNKIQPITKKHQSLLFGLHILKIYKHTI